MGFLLFLGMCAASLYGMQDIASGMKTRECKGELAKENYSIDQFETILRLHRVKRIKMDNGMEVLPKDGYSLCLNYIEKEPLTDETDIQEFIDHYNAVRNQEIQDLHDHWDEVYHEKRQEYQNIRSDEDEVYVFQKKHRFLDRDADVSDIKDMIHDLYHSTFWGELCIKPGKLVRDESSEIGTWLEIWVVQCPDGLEKAEEYYKACKNSLYFADG